MADSVRRGEIYWVDLDPSRGVELRGRRPALVVQNDRGNASAGSTVIAAISSAQLPRVYPFTVKLESGEANLPKAGFVNCSQLLTIDMSRLMERIGELPADRMLEVGEALRYELDL